MLIHKLILPTPFPVGPVNVYLIDERPLTLLDTGPNTPEALAALEEQLDTVGHGLQEIKRIVISHTHMDHCGLAAKIQRASGAPVFVHPWEENRLTRPFDYIRSGRILAQAGVPREVLAQLDRRRERYQDTGEALTDVKLLEEADELNFSHGTFRVVHTPGHTPGHLCLFREAERLLIAGDTVLERITPNPVISPDPRDPDRRFPSLKMYLQSLDRLRGMAPSLIHTGHGRDITDMDTYQAGLLRHHKDRQQKVIELVGQGSATAWEISQRLFPHLNGDHLFLAVSEASAHLDMAVSEGLVSMDAQDGVHRFRRVLQRLQ